MQPSGNVPVEATVSQVLPIEGRWVRPGGQILQLSQALFPRCLNDGEVESTGAVARRLYAYIRKNPL